MKSEGRSFFGLDKAAYAALTEEERDEFLDYYRMGRQMFCNDVRPFLLEQAVAGKAGVLLKGASEPPAKSQKVRRLAVEMLNSWIIEELERLNSAALQAKPDEVQ